MKNCNHLLLTSLIYLAILNHNNAQSNQKESTKIAWSKLNLPLNHMPYFFFSNRKLQKLCIEDEKCPFKEQANSTELKCWGYEPKCNFKSQGKLFLPECPGDSKGWVIIIILHSVNKIQIL